MTETQIKYVLNKIGYSVNKWDSFDKFSIIVVDCSKLVCTSKKNRRIRFNTTTHMLEVCEGVTIKNVFTTNYNETDEDDYTPTYRVSLDSITGFVQSLRFLPNGVLVRA